MTLQTRDLERQIGARTLRAGDTVRIVGVRGEWRIVGFVGDTVDVYGAVTARRAPLLRTFTVDRIGTRRRQRT